MVWHEQNTPPVEVEIVLAWHEAQNEGDVARLFALCADDIEAGGPELSGRGLTSLLRHFGPNGVRLELQAFLQRGPVVVVAEEVLLPPALDATPRVTSGAAVFKVEGGYVTSVLLYRGLPEALRAAGIGNAANP